MSTIYTQMVTQIVKEQQAIVGPVAFEVLQHIKGVSVDKKTLKSTFTTKDERAAVDEVIDGYAALFGRASVEVCKDAVRGLLSDLEAKDIPSALT